MLTKPQYKRILSTASLTDSESAVLFDVYKTGRTGKTATEVAISLGIGTYQTVNALFGKVGHKFSQISGRLPDVRKNGSYRWWQLLAYDRSEQGRGLVWVLHENLSDAILELGLYPKGHTELELRKQVVSALEDNPEIRRSRLEAAPKYPDKITITSSGFLRNPDVIAEVLIRANGHCEYCKSAAPFSRQSDNSPYLEVHHILPLSDGGMDTIDNAVGLCPNCHRKAHYG